MNKPMNIIKLSQVNSTNQYIKDHLIDLHDFDVVYTTKQTQGRGRRLHHWFSNEESLTFSLLLKLPIKKDIVQLMPFYSAFILREILKQYTEDIQIKWPNDILVQNKKLAGILIESVIQGQDIYIIIGIGININQNEFPANINDIAISLKHITKQTYQPFTLLKEIIRLFLDEFNGFISNPKTIMDYCQKNLAYKNQIVTFTNLDKSHIGRCKGINQLGHLIIDVDGQIQTFLNGDIEYIRPYKTKEL